MTTCDAGFRRLRADPRFEAAVGGPPPRPAPSPGQDAPRRVGTVLLLFASSVVAYVCGLLAIGGLMLVIGLLQVHALALVAGFGVVAFAAGRTAQGAWRRLSPPRPASPSDPGVVRAAARIAGIEIYGGGLGDVVLEGEDGELHRHPARRGLCPTLTAGDLGVAYVVHGTGRLVDFVPLLRGDVPAA